ncbi:C2 domain [Popillia japonica]|uniref:C2 domain n=1 Tax=Popillia japonica TaxID=7064 RepID=A0AAW1KPH4_POPJA
MADPQGNKNLGFPPTSDVLGTFLTQLLQNKQKNYVENSTNTDNKQIAHEQNNLQENIGGTKIRKTSDLLDSLQQALSINTLPQMQKQTSMHNLDTFKAHVVVENALHLPSRKKCKARIVQGKPRFEELLPSAFVSFETGSGLKVTDVVKENKNPEWDYNCEVKLPADLLTNNQKRFIFKIWKKLLNAPPFEPNLESDTILGFAALDLTVLLAGMPTVSGWFNIWDLPLWT